MGKGRGLLNRTISVTVCSEALEMVYIEAENSWDAKDGFYTLKCNAHGVFCRMGA